MDLALSPELQRVLVEPPKQQSNSPRRPTVHEIESEDEEVKDVKQSETPPEVSEEPQEPDMLAPPSALESELEDSPAMKGMHIWERQVGEDPNLWVSDSGIDPRLRVPSPPMDPTATVMPNSGNDASDMSFGEAREKESNPALLTWLTTNKLEEIYHPLLCAGYDDIELMADQMKSNMPITN
jgi:hypothetical protein